MYNNKINYYWSNKTAMAQKAIKHTEEMERTYSVEIDECINNSVIYDTRRDFFTDLKEYKKDIDIKLVSIGSVEAIFKYGSETNKTAVLNFASYKNPGGGFIAGSKAQEECLCHSSFLYNVLSEKQDYYNWNNEHKNRSLYLNRAIYSPDVYFFQEGQKKKCDVITCAAPNFASAKKYCNVEYDENEGALIDRIMFILDIAAKQEVKILILGAYGCGVFGQDASEVADIFLKFLKVPKYRCFDKVIFAVPDNIHADNYEKFLARMTG